VAGTAGAASGRSTANATGGGGGESRIRVRSQQTRACDLGCGQEYWQTEFDYDARFTASLVAQECHDARWQTVSYLVFARFASVAAGWSRPLHSPLPPPVVAAARGGASGARRLSKLDGRGSAVLPLGLQVEPSPGWMAGELRRPNLVHALGGGRFPDG